MKRLLRAWVCLVLAFSLALPLSGCWDEHELDTLAIVTGIALDRADAQGLVDLTVQVGKAASGSSASGETNAKDASSLVFKTTCGTILDGLNTLDRDSSRSLFLDHNQVLLFGSSLAQEGLGGDLDLFLRAQESRMEVLVLVTRCPAEDVLKARLSQQNISGLYLANLMAEQYKICPAYRVRLLDFESRLREKTTAPVAPLICLKQTDGETTLSVDGLAVFRADRMIGTLSSDQAEGYIWAMGDVKQGDIPVGCADGTAVFRITALDTDRSVSLREDGSAAVTLNVSATLDVGELDGFANVPQDQLMPRLKALAEEAVRTRILDTFDYVRALDADIYGFGTSVYREYPKQWESMRDRWDSLFPDLALTVNVQARIPYTGETVGPALREENAQ